MVARVADEPADAVELLVAREDQEALAGSAPAVVLLLDLVDELADQVQDAVPHPDPLPEVVRRVSRLGRRDRWIPGAAVAPLVERQEPGPGAPELGRDEHLIRIHREVGEAARVAEEWFARIPILLILADRVRDVLPRERVLEFGREDGDAVQEEGEVEALFALLAEVELTHNREQVGPVEAL